MKNTDGTRSIKYGKGGKLAEDPRHLHVCMEYQGRTLLGEVRDCYFTQDEGAAGFRLVVRHFNGEEWPVRPVPTAVRVLLQG